MIFSSKTMAWAINTLSNWKSVLTDFWTWLVRPGELRNVQEGHINLQEKWIVFPQPRKRDPKFIHLLPQHCELIQSIWPPRALPHIYFFRHLTSRSGIRAGDRFGQKYLKPWWDRACKTWASPAWICTAAPNTAPSPPWEKLSPEQIQRGATGHASDAFKRYLLPDMNEAIMEIDQMQSYQHVINIFEGIKKDKKLNLLKICGGGGGS